MSSWSWSAAALPTRTGAEPRWPSRWSSSRSGRSVRPSMPYMICSGPVWQPSPRLTCSVRKFMNASASLGEAQPQHRVHAEGGVAHPHVPVVPVAFAAELLGQAGRRRGHDRAGRRVGEQLQGEGGAVHHLPPAAPVLGGGQPLPPVRHRAAELFLGLGPRAPAQASPRRRACPARTPPTRPRASLKSARTSGPSTSSGMVAVSPSDSFSDSNTATSPAMRTVCGREP